MDLQSDIRDDLLAEVSSQRDTIVESFDPALEEKFAKLEQNFLDQEWHLDRSQSNQLGHDYGDAALRTRQQSRAEKLVPRHLPARVDTVGVRLRRASAVCRPGCPCGCHQQKKVSSPAIVDRLLGQLFVGFSGVPLLSPKCSDRLCERAQSPYLNLEYWFPMGLFWSQILRLQLAYQANTGPHLQLSTLRRVADGSTCIGFALGGNIEGLKDLFRRGLASPRDVSTTRGYSVLRWALYGKQYETCRFLLHEGADPDYRPVAPYDNSPKNKAHDFLLQGRLSKTAEEVLRALTQGSDWIDEQNYTLIHRSVLGLTFVTVENAILQHPDDVNTPDTMGRTPLSWAAARGDERALAILLANGADPNIMDQQVSTALDYAADRGYAICCRQLLEAKARPDPKKPAGMKTGGALNCAARNTTNPLTLKTLLDFGADIESCGVDSKTSLIHVARTDNFSFALLLLEYGADINATSTTGETPLTTAITHNSHNVLKLLLRRWFEYSECPRLKGPHLLQIVAKYADAETIAILTATDHSCLTYDKYYGKEDLTAYLRDRHDAHENLDLAFSEMISSINHHEPDMRRSELSLMEANLLGNDDTDITLEKLIEKIPVIQVSADSDEDDFFENAKGSWANDASASLV